MKNKFKKAFTLVELLVVIAILSALTTIGIIGFKTFKTKANLSSDSAMVDQLNRYTKALKEKGELGDVKTTTDVAEALFEDGFDLNELKPLSSGYKFAFDIDADKFCLVNDNNQLTDYVSNTKHNIQVFCASSAEVDALANDGYSVYMQRANYSKTAYTNLKVGIDTGVNDEITEISYVGTGATQNVVFHTCSENTKLTINDNSDSTLYHYGVAGYLNIIKCSTHSFVECGYVPVAEIQSGRVVNEKGTILNEYQSEVPVGVQFLYINASQATPNTFDEIVVAAVDGAKYPTLKRDAVTIPANGTLVIKLEEVTNKSITGEEYVYLYKSGIKEQIVTYPKKLDAEGISGSIVNSNVVGKVNGQTVTLIVGTDSIADAKNQKAAIEVSCDPVGTVTAADLDRADIPVKEEPAKQVIINSYEYFGGNGLGTEESPFKIYDYATMQNVSKLYDEFNYFEVDIAKCNGFIDCNENNRSWEPVKLNGNFDGKGVVFNNVDHALFKVVGASADTDADGENILVQDFTAYMNTKDGSALVRTLANAGLTTFKDVNLHGSVEGESNVAGWINFGTRNASTHGASYQVKWKNCVNDVKVTCTTGNTSGGFFAHMYAGDETNNSKVDFIFENTTYTGSMMNNSNANNCRNYFGIGTSFINTITVDSQEKTLDEFNTVCKHASVFANVLPMMNKTLSENNRKYFVVKQLTVQTIKVTVCAQLTAYDDTGKQLPGLTGITMSFSTEEITTSETGKVKVFDKVENIEIVYDADEYKSELIGTTLKIYLKTATNYAEGYVRLQVNQYDAQDNIVAAGTYDLAKKVYGKSWNILDTIFD